jgi:hypothetical protein
MNTYFETAVTSPDEKMIESERKDLLLQVEHMHKEIDRLNGELSHMRSDNEALKEAVVRMSLKMVGVTH